LRGSASSSSCGGSRECLHSQDVIRCQPQENTVMGAVGRSVTVSLMVLVAWMVAGCAGIGSSAQHTDRGTADAMNSIGAAAEGGRSRVVSEALTSMDNTTNGFATQADMDEARDHFEEIEVIADGLGPVYNAQSCRECHQNPVTGGGSQVTEFRTGH